MKKEYSWKNHEFKAVNAAVAAESLHDIKTKYGEIKPDGIVAEARHRDHPLHPLFPWDDAEAAQIGREHIASRIIRSIHVEIIREDRPPIRVRAFVSVQDPKARGGVSYAVTIDAMADPESRAFILRQAWLMLRAWRRKYGDLSELSDVFDAIDAMEVKRSQTA